MEPDAHPDARPALSEARTAPASTAALDRWFLWLLVASTLLQASNSIVRPWASYRALEIGVDPGALGLLAAGYALTPLLFALSVGRLIDRRGALLFVTIGATVMAISSASLAPLDQFLPLLVLLATAGLAHMVSVIAIQTLIATRSGVSAYDRRFAHLSFVASLGQLIGPALGAVVAGDGSPEGTSRAFLVSGGLAAICLPIVFWVRFSDPGHAHAKGGEEATRPPLKEILRTPGMMPAMLASLTVLSAIDVLVVYLPALGEERGIAVSAIGALLAVRAGASMASRLSLGWLVDRMGRRRLLVASMVVAAAGIMLLPFVPLPAMFVVMVFTGAGLGIGQPLTMSWVASRAAPGARATALSVRLMGNRLGQVTLPLVAGVAAAAAGAAAVLVTTALAVGASVVVVSRRTPKDAS
jgi:MFS family permease